MRRFRRGFRNSSRILPRGFSDRFGVRASRDSGLAQRATRMVRSSGCEMPAGSSFSGAISKATGSGRRSIASAASMRSCSGCASSPICRTSPAYQYDAFCLDTRPARQLSEEIARTENVAPRDYSRLEGALVDLCQESPVSAGAQRQRQAVSARRAQGRCHPRARRAAGRAHPLRVRCERRSRRAPARRAARVRRHVRAGEGEGRRARLSRSASQGAQPGSRRCRGAPQLPAALQASVRRRVSGHRSAAGGDPAAPGRGRSRRYRLAEGSTHPRQALHRRRPEAVDLSIQARGRRHLPRRLRDAAGSGSEARDAAHQLPRQAEHSAHHQRRVCACHDGRCAGCAGRLRPARAVPIRFAGAAIGGCASCPRAVRQTADCEHVN